MPTFTSLTKSLDAQRGTERGSGAVLIRLFNLLASGDHPQKERSGFFWSWVINQALEFLGDNGGSETDRVDCGSKRDPCPNRPFDGPGVVEIICTRTLEIKLAFSRIKYEPGIF
jgi:hypothetical protein